MTQFTDKDRQALESLRARGHAVVTFNPDDLQGADSGDVEDRLVDLGWQVIEVLATEPEEDLWQGNPKD